MIAKLCSTCHACELHPAADQSLQFQCRRHPPQCLAVVIPGQGLTISSVWPIVDTESKDHGCHDWIPMSGGNGST